jgi:metallophosphoesterase (TIGR00282 family)
MKILTVGDVVGECGLNFLKKNLSAVKKFYGADFTVVNGENVLSGSGISLPAADSIFHAGADCITLGNHAFSQKSVEKAFERYPKNLIRPLNYDGSLEGEGYTVLDANLGTSQRIGIINLVGRIFMMPVNCPFLAADKAVAYMQSQNVNIIIVDFHAEATSEKKAMGYYLDGRVSAVFGTHTHTQTADEQILPGKTGFITDIGMTGSTDSVLGLKKEISINRIVHHKTAKYEWSDTAPALMGAVFDIDGVTGRCDNVERVKIE